MYISCLSSHLQLSTSFCDRFYRRDDMHIARYAVVASVRLPATIRFCDKMAKAHLPKCSNCKNRPLLRYKTGFRMFCNNLHPNVLRRRTRDLFTIKVDLVTYCSSNRHSISLFSVASFHCLIWLCTCRLAMQYASAKTQSNVVANIVITRLNRLLTFHIRPSYGDIM